MKIQVAEILVPAVLRLYTRLKPRGGQINVYLVQLANDLLKDYEQEVIIMLYYYHSTTLIKLTRELMTGLQTYVGGARRSAVRY